MELRLTLKGPERLLGGRTDASLRDGALVIGRSPEADWAIADPERIISKLHCRIEKDFDSFQLTDTSTNGVRVNETPVGYGLACRIQDGDVIKLGDAVLTARVVTQETAPPPAAATAGPLPPDVFADGPFGDAPPESQVAAAPPPAQRPVESPASGTVLDDWWGPVDATAPQEAANPVDISPARASGPIGDVHAGEDSLLSPGTDVASLLRMAVGLDVDKLARLVGEATAVLSADERGKFMQRLSEGLRGVSRR